MTLFRVWNALGACLLLAAQAHAADLQWARSWGASPQAPAVAMGAFSGSPTFHDQTIRQVVRLSGCGGGCRLAGERSAPSIATDIPRSS